MHCTDLVNENLHATSLCLRSDFPQGPFLPMISYKTRPNEYTSPFCEPKLQCIVSSEKLTGSTTAVDMAKEARLEVGADGNVAGVA